MKKKAREIYYELFPEANLVFTELFPSTLSVKRELRKPPVPPPTHSNGQVLLVVDNPKVEYPNKVE